MPVGRRFRRDLELDFMVSWCEVLTRFSSPEARDSVTILLRRKCDFNAADLDVTISDSENNDERDGDGGLRLVSGLENEGHFRVFVPFFFL